MPLIRPRPTSTPEPGPEVVLTFPDVASIIQDLNTSELSKTARRFSRSTNLPFRGTSRSQAFRKDVVVGDCPNGQNYYICQNTKFKGCCSKNACDPKVTCPEKNELGETTSAKPVTKANVDQTTDSGSASATKSETRSIKSAVTSAAGSPSPVSANGTTVSRATADLANAPSCPSGNGTTFTDNTNIAYVVRCATDHTAPSFNSIEVSIGGYAQCFSSCSTSKDCVGFSYVGLDGGTCYLKSVMPRDGFVARGGNNYVSCAKIDPAANAPRPTETSSPDAGPKSPNKGAIAGGVVGGIAIIGLVLFLIAFLARRRRKHLENKRATITHVFGGAVEPGHRNGDDDAQTLPLHNRSGSTSHDVFAPYGGYQRGISGSIAKDYANQHQNASPTSNKSVGGVNKTPYPQTPPVFSALPNDKSPGAASPPFLLPATTYQPGDRPSSEVIPMLDSTPVPRSKSRSPRFHEHIMELEDTSSTSPAPPAAAATNRRWGSVLYAGQEAETATSYFAGAATGPNKRLEDARRRQQQLHMMSWNNYDENQAAELPGVGATIGRAKARPGERGGERAVEGEVSPDQSASPLDRSFVVSPVGTLDGVKR